jgi:hypothetical protein
MLTYTCLVSTVYRKMLDLFSSVVTVLVATAS